jgi:amino acid adenylation domain-containing protein
MQNQIEGFRCSMQQRRLWLLRNECAAYRAQCAIKIEGHLDQIGLKENLQSVIDRHEILRTTFHRLAGMRFPLQVVGPSRSLSWRSLDLTHIGAQQQEHELNDLMRQGLDSEFDPEGCASLRVCLARLSDDRHALLMTLDSLCGDARTLRNIVEELSASGGGSFDGGPECDEPIQYKQYSEWQNELIESEEGLSGKQYWREQNIGAIPHLRLPGELKRGDACFDPASLSTVLDSEMTERINNFARQQECSLDDLLLACWKALLSRLTGQQDIAVAYVVDDRKYEGLGTASGLFAKSVAVKTAVEGSLRLTELLRQVSDVTASAREWQEYFDWEDIGASSDGDSATDFAFEFAHMPAPFRAHGASFFLYKQYQCFDRYKIKFGCLSREDFLELEFHYDRAFFSEGFIKQMIDRFVALLDSVVENPQATLDQLEVVGPDERRHLILKLNQTASSHPSGRCVHELLEEQASRTADRVAVVSQEGQITFRELNHRANQLAHHLRAGGVGPEVMVGICVPRSIDMVIGIIAILKAGGAYVPLDMSYPAQRLAYILEDAQIRVLLTREQLIKMFPDYNGQVVFLDTGCEAAAFQADAGPLTEVTSENLAYVIYTSGSTGRPKGVMIHHKGVVNYLSWCALCYKTEGEGGSLVHSSVGFDLTITSLFLPLLTGNRITLVPEENGIEGLSHALRLGSYGLVKITPSHLDLLNRQLPAEETKGRVNVMVVGGEALRADSLALWRNHARDIRIINEYGPTETVVGCCAYEIPAGDIPAGRVPIGKPIANTQIYLLNEHSNLIPSGSTGELCVAGHGVGRGYVRMPEMTAERFVPDPFCAEFGGRIYRTGDMGSIGPDDNIEFLGRVDHQVKVRGYRIELGEIEAALSRHPEVQESIVRATESESGNQRLVAYVVRKPGFSPPVDQLNAYLAESLPDYMIPSAYVMPDKLPLTPNGKVDQSALSVMETSRPERYVAARTPTEKIVTDIWSEILGTQRIGINDNFFHIGGHSLLATQVVSQIRERFGVEIPLTSLFEKTTVEHLSALIEAALDLEVGPPSSGESITIAATFDAAAVDAPLAFWSEELELDLDIQFVTYDQMMRQFLEPRSLVASNATGIVALLIRFEDWLRAGPDEATEGLVNFQPQIIEDRLRGLVSAFASARAIESEPRLVFICPPSPACVGHSDFFAQMEEKLRVELDEIEDVFLVTPSELNALYPVSAYDQRALVWEFSQGFFTALATMIARKVFAIKSEPYAAIVLDCDQIFWPENGGQIPESALAREAIQEFVAAQQDAGMLLCLCGKNDEQAIFETFKQSSHMPLSRARISAWSLNPASKSEKIKSLAGELNLELSRFIVIDNDPTACEEIQINCPDVLLLQPPDDPAIVRTYFDHVWAFDPLRPPRLTRKSSAGQSWRK